MNNITITGNLGKDPQTRYTPTGRKITSFSVAVDRQWKDAEGEKKEEVTWLNVETWNGLGEVCEKYLCKGRRVLVNGRLSIRPYTDQEGQSRLWVAVVASNVEFLDGPRQQENRAEGEVISEDLPF